MQDQPRCTEDYDQAQLLFKLALCYQTATQTQESGVEFETAHGSIYWYPLDKMQEAQVQHCPFTDSSHKEMEWTMRWILLQAEK